MAALLRVDQMNVPTRRGDKFFFSRRLAQENQSSIYMRIGLHGVDRKLIDGNTRSADGNTSVNMQGISQDGSILIYGVRVGGLMNRRFTSSMSRPASIQVMYCRARGTMGSRSLRTKKVSTTHASSLMKAAGCFTTRSGRQ
jgi:Prolyl oligopeptidase, N-terminal beta-propeller domain